MSKSKQITCTCGGTFEGGVCTSCGKRQPRSGGYRFFHTLLCVIGILILWFCFANTVSLRSYCGSGLLTEALRSAKLSDAAIPFTGKNLAEYVKSNYVTDENVLTEDVAEAADGMGIPAFLADKLDAHFAMLRGESDTPVRIGPEEVTGLLDQITESLHESCKLIIEDSDRQQIQSVAEPVLSKFNAVSDGLGSTKAGRAIERFGVSMLAYILELVLLGLLIWRWCVIRRNGGRDIAGAFKGTGIVILIPAALSLLFVLIGGIRTFFVRDDVIGLNGVTKAIRGPYWYIAITGVSFALLMIELCGFIRARKLYLETAPAKPKKEKKQNKMQDTAVTPVYRVPCVKCGKELESGSKFCKYCGASQEQPKAEAPASPAASPAPAAAGKVCVCCGKELAADMKFCKYCGTNQETGENIVDAVLNGTAGFPEAPEDDNTAS